MTNPLTLDPIVVAVIAVMAAVTYLTKIGGLWLLTRVEISDRVEASLEVLPGAIIVAVLGPELASGGPPEWLAGGIVAAVAWKTENILVALATGIGAIVVFRAVL